jgi:CO dehydrogenase/acetyl-CoA synthase beta subunit
LSEQEQKLDYRVQINRLNEVVGSWGDLVKSFCLSDHQAFVDEIGLAPRGDGSPSVVVGDAVGAELGRPGCPSRAAVLATLETDLVNDGMVRYVGPDLDQICASDLVPLAQIIVLGCKSDQLPDPFELESTQYLANRLQGFMARTVPGRLWLRVSKEVIAAGFRLATLGCALIAAYKQDFKEVIGAEVVLVTGTTERVQALDSIAAEAKVLSGRHRKLTLVEGGEYECQDLNCDDCEEQETCDSLRDVYVRYRQRGTN